MTRKAMRRLVVCTMLGATLLSACAPTVRVKSWKISQPQELRDCDPAKLPPRPSQPLTAGTITEQVTEYSVEQQAAFNVCRAKTQANTAIIDAHNRQVEDLTRPWWKFW
jgi:hypothetical protein